MLSQYFLIKGYEIRAALSGLEAIEKVKEKPDIILLDINMPKKNGIEVYILSSVLSDSPYALKEKNAWLDQYLPELDAEHRIFPACGQDKKDYIPGTPGKTDFLLDDYTKNLQLWEVPCVGIKLLNGINNTHGWKGKKVDRKQRPDILAEQIQMQMEKAESRKIVKQAYQRGR